MYVRKLAMAFWLKLKVNKDHYDLLQGYYLASDMPPSEGYELFRQSNWNATTENQRPQRFKLIRQVFKVKHSDEIDGLNLPRK